MQELAGVAPPVSTKRSTPAKGLLLFGPFLVATFGGPLFADWLREVPRGTVKECAVFYEHGPNAKVVLASGDVAWLSTKDLAFPEQCVAAGIVLEKRRFELAYRLDGRPAAAGSPTHLVALITSALGGLMAAAGLVMVVKQRRRKQSP